MDFPSSQRRKALITAVYTAIAALCADPILSATPVAFQELTRQLWRFLLQQGPERGLHGARELLSKWANSPLSLGECGAHRVGRENAVAILSDLLASCESVDEAAYAVGWMRRGVERSEDLSVLLPVATTEELRLFGRTQLVRDGSRGFGSFAGECSLEELLQNLSTNPNGQVDVEVWEVPASITVEDGETPSGPSVRYLGCFSGPSAASLCEEAFREGWDHPSVDDIIDRAWIPAS